MIYTPSYFQITDLSFIYDLVEQNNFATMLCSKNGPPVVSHLQFLLDRQRGQFGTLWGHMAKANPQWKLFTSGAEVLVIFSGPHAYISPAWYTPSPRNVPTWNYAVAHGYGIARVVSDEEAYAGLKKLVERHEQASKTGWVLEPTAEVRDMLKQITAFEISITRWEGKAKFSQNQNRKNAQGAWEGLLAADSEERRRAGEMMKDLHDARSLN